MEYLLETILIQALKLGSSDIHITQTTLGVSVQFRIKGKLQNYNQYEQAEGGRLLNYLKFLSNIDLNHRLTPHTGHFEYFMNQCAYSFRVSSIPTLNGENLVIRVLHHGQSLTLNQLTHQKAALIYLQQLIKCRSGLIIVCGPTGEGKSTTLHALLHAIIQNGKVNIITIEDPIEIVEPDFIQIQVNFDAGINFEESLKQILRHDPDVVMIGEIRDEISAALALRCALTGCLVLSTLHSKNCQGAIKRLKNLKINELDLMDTLQAVISQRLIHTSNNSFALYEWLNEEDIHHYLTKGTSSYQDFIKRIQESISQKESRLEDYENSEFYQKLFID